MGKVLKCPLKGAFLQEKGAEPSPTFAVVAEAVGLYDHKQVSSGVTDYRDGDNCDRGVAMTDGIRDRLGNDVDDAGSKRGIFRKFIVNPWAQIRGNGA